MICVFHCIFLRRACFLNGLTLSQVFNFYSDQMMQISVAVLQNGEIWTRNVSKLRNMLNPAKMIYPAAVRRQVPPAEAFFSIPRTYAALLVENPSKNKK